MDGLDGCGHKRCCPGRGFLEPISLKSKNESEEVEFDVSEGPGGPQTTNMIARSQQKKLGGGKSFGPIDKEIKVLL